MIKKALVVLSASLVLGACSYKTAAPTTNNQPNPAGQVNTQTVGVLTINSFAFSPEPLKVMASSVVNVQNKDNVAHTVTSDDGGFDSGSIASGANGRFTAPSKPGTYTFHCSVHPSMKGTLIVQ